MSDIFRGPLIFRTWRRDPNSIAAQSQNEFIQPSFPPLIPAAVVEYDLGFSLWGLPERLREQRQDYIAESNMALLTVVMPCNQYSWPVPRGPSRGQDWQAFNILIATSGVTTNPGFNEWAVPSGPPRLLDYTWVQSGNALTAPTARPCGVQFFDLPPRAPSRPVTNLTHTDSFKLPLQQQIQPNQYNWPNPRDYARGRQFWIDYTLPWAQAPPINQTDWPVPRGPRRNPQDWDDSFKLPLQQTLPLNQYDWPNPRGPLRGRQDWLQQVPLALSSAVQPPFFKTDWPNPILRVVRRQDWDDNFKLPLQQTLPLNQKNWPNPVLAKRNPQDWILPQPYVLNTVVANPFVPADWPNSRGPSRPDLTWTQSGLALADIFDPASNDLGNPDGPQSKPQDWIAGSNIALLTATVVEYDLGFNLWGLPERLRRNPQDWTLSQPYVLNVVVAPSPFSQTDWPVPRGPRRNPQDWSDSFKLPLQQNQLLNQHDWPNPILPLARRPDWILPQPYVLNTVVGNPIVPIDWPVPRGPRRNPQDWDDSFKLPLQQTLPENQYQWPNPPLAARRNPQDWIQSIPRALASTIPPPIAQYDWPVPKGQPPRQFWTDRFKLPLQQTLPENQYNWPNPVLARKPVVADWILSVPSTLTFVQPPLNQHDWPNPLLRKGSLLPTWTDWFKLPLQQTLPPRQLDWPNPRGPLQPGVSVLAYLLITQPSPPLPPIYDDRLTLKNEVRRTRELSNKSGRVRFLKNEIRR